MSHSAPPGLNRKGLPTEPDPRPPMPRSRQRNHVYAEPVPDVVLHRRRVRRETPLKRQQGNHQNVSRHAVPAEEVQTSATRLVAHNAPGPDCGTTVREPSGPAPSSPLFSGAPFRSIGAGSNFRHSPPLPPSQASMPLEKVAEGGGGLTSPTSRAEREPCGEWVGGTYPPKSVLPGGGSTPPTLFMCFCNF